MRPLTHTADRYQCDPAQLGALAAWLVSEGYTPAPHGPDELARLAKDDEVISIGHGGEVSARGDRGRAARRLLEVCKEGQ